MNTKIILPVLIIAIISIVAIVGALQLAERMNEVVAPFSSVDRPVSVIDAQMDPHPTGQSN